MCGVCLSGYVGGAADFSSALVEVLRGGAKVALCCGEVFRAAAAMAATPRLA